MKYLFIGSIVLVVASTLGYDLSRRSAIAHHRYRPAHGAKGGITAPTNQYSSNEKPSFTVSSNKILDSNGRQYIPYGFVVWCLSNPDLSCNRHSKNNPISDLDRISAAAKTWHANTIRIQVAYEHLFGGAGAAVDQTYLSDLDSEVELANSLHMIAIITQQTERFNGSLLPDMKSIAFWMYMASHYKENSMVFFDLFNEPRLNVTETGVTSAKIWDTWQKGGVVLTRGQSVTYVGMQTLVDTVRNQGATNIVIAEGNHGDHDLSLLPSHLLTGPNVAYGQEPDLASPSKNYSFWLNGADENEAEWSANWGKLSSVYPIMMEAFQDHPGSFCYRGSAEILPKLLAYLRNAHLGLIYYALDPGLGIVGHDLGKPTAFENGVFDCSGRGDPVANTVGPGADILAWFAANSVPVG